MNNGNRISFQTFFDEINEPRSRYGDCLFEVLGIPITTTTTNTKSASATHTHGEDRITQRQIQSTFSADDHEESSIQEKEMGLSFGEFVQSIVTMCLLDKEDILRYCFYVFDSNKNGYIDTDELDEMLDLLHDIHPQPQQNQMITVDNNDKHRNQNNSQHQHQYDQHEQEIDGMKGDTKKARRKLEKHIGSMASIIGGQMELHEIKNFSEKFPRLFYPAFCIQNKLMSKYFGFPWWEHKRQALHRRNLLIFNQFLLIKIHYRCILNLVC